MHNETTRESSRFFVPYALNALSLFEHKHHDLYQW